MTHDSFVPVTLGFAAGRHGNGVAYVRMRGADGGDALVRVTFRCRPLPALRGRDVAYAALEATATRLRTRGLSSVRFAVNDTTLAADIAEHRPVPNSLTIPYVRLQCALNRFARATVVAVEDESTRDLTARARAEVALDVAA
ncbi:MAG: hypothetical protein NVS3B17_07230 [Vulcanimicrobiaceae bacterium]